MCRIETWSRTTKLYGARKLYNFVVILIGLDVVIDKKIFNTFFWKKKKNNNNRFINFRVTNIGLCFISLNGSIINEEWETKSVVLLGYSYIWCMDLQLLFEIWYSMYYKFNPKRSKKQIY